MSKSIYLINPRSDFPTYFGGEVFGVSGFDPAVLMADLATPTVAALAPPDFDVRICDEHLSPVELAEADFVCITGKITQHTRMVALAEEFRRQKCTVIMGGPHATLSPESLRPHCDVLVRGEIEEIAGELFADLRNSCWKEEYAGGRPDLAGSPVPLWSAYPNHRAIMGTVQTSRGCPFECEFCDVIQYLGRKQRHKPVERVLAELDEIARLQYRTVFLADDNFTVYRSRARELLDALAHWNRSRAEGRLSFVTQVSIDACRDDELLRMCSAAGLTHVFIGIETPNQESLKETKKRQNLGLDMDDRIERFLDHGIAVTAGMIVGFDSDGLDIFERQFEFAMSLPIPIFTLGALVAPAATPLHKRMALENRLVENGSEVAAMPWTTNIIPRGMSRPQLLSGLRWLCNRLYAPQAFEARMLHFIDRLEDRRGGGASFASSPEARVRAIETETFSLLGKFFDLGEEEGKIFSRIRKRIAQRPHTAEFAISMLVQYMQIRHMYGQGGIWDQGLASLPEPSWDEVEQSFSR
jgi:hypothetical protein